jgi:hypothetical protein
MNYFLGLSLLTLLYLSPVNEKQNHQAEVLQIIFDIEEFQKYLTQSPRYVSTNTKQEILMLDFPELENQNIQLSAGRKSVRVISQKDMKDLKHNFIIQIDEFDLKKSKAKILLSYLNPRIYYEKNQKVLLNAELEKNNNNKWIVVDYKLEETNLNTFD